MDSHLLDLSWLAEPPADFRQQTRSLSNFNPDSPAIAHRLAKCRLDCNNLYSLGKRVSQLAAERAEVTRLGVLSNGTMDLCLPALSASALRHGVWTHTIGTGFNQVVPEALNPSSRINQARCHFVLLCIDHRGLPFTTTPGDPKSASAAVDSALRYIDDIRLGLRNASGCTVIVQTVPQDVSTLFGSLEGSVPGTLRWLIAAYNRELRTRAADSGDLLLDVAALAENIGVARWHDPVQWTLGKFPFAHAAIPIYADWVGRLIAAARGRARKCLVLDLDNTLWGGVIGDDGLAGIVLGNGSPAGESHLKIQQTALALRERGVVLAVSSKNDEDVARSAFRSHPEMLLKEEHIAVFQANWRDKASNLKAIADALNIGLDALVLLDDNPAERKQVRDALPAVAVPELPSDPAFYADILLAAGYFEATQFTAEDRHRAAQYQANAARGELLASAADLGSYLRSLEMRAIFRSFDRIGRTRITQLINKTNQFNLTTRRYTELEVEAFERSSSGLTLQVRLIDRFGDNGIVAVVICVEENSDWAIDTWLMSCRVLNRRLEEATLNYIVSRARTKGVRALIGQYVRTDRNGLVEDHYAHLGFSPLRLGKDESRWELRIASYETTSIPMEIVEEFSTDAESGPAEGVP